MRIGIVSDIHGNIGGLETALDLMGAVDEVWCAGDAVNQYQFSNEVVGRLREIGARYVLGNHEELLLSPAGRRAQKRDGVDADLLDWMRDRPHWVEATFDGLRVVMFHSTPWQPYGEYLYPHSRDLERLSELEADVAIYGHTHTKMARSIEGTLVVNPGSTGIGAAHNGSCARNRHRLSFAVLDTGSAEVHLEEFDDPLQW